MIKVGVGIQGVGRYSDRLLWLDPDVILFMQGDVEEIRWLRAHGWQGEAWLRFYDGNSMGDSPEVYAARVQQWLAENDYGIDIKHVVLWNELNLACEHNNAGIWDSVDAYIAINEWCCKCLLCFRELTYDKYILHWGALSPGHNPPGYDPESEYDLLLPSLQAADIIDTHVYGSLAIDEYHGSRRIKRIVAKLNSLGILTSCIAITETNQIDYVELLSWLKAYLPELEGVSWFLWSAADPQHAAYDLVKQDLGLLRAFIIENKEEGMTYNRVGVWASYQRKLLEMPMFQKVRAAHPELGDPLQRMSMAIPSNTVWGHICSRIMLVA